MCPNERENGQNHEIERWIEEIETDFKHKIKQYQEQLKMKRKRN